MRRIQRANGAGQVGSDDGTAPVVSSKNATTATDKPKKPAAKKKAGTGARGKRGR